MRFVIPARKQPKIIDAFKAGYETLSRHLYLLLFPILLDIFFLFGKRFLISEQIEGFVKSIVLPNSATTEILESWQELSSSLVETVQHFSLTSFLRTYPIGTPSLLAHRNLTENPLTAFSTTQVTSPWTTILLVILFSLIGFIYGALFLLVIRNAVVVKKRNRTEAKFSQRPGFIVHDPDRVNHCLHHYLAACIIDRILIERAITIIWIFGLLLPHIYVDLICDPNDFYPTPHPSLR